jgi:hypothetical protein
MFWFCHRWVKITLGGFGETSTINWRSGPGKLEKTIVLPRGSMGERYSEGRVTQEVLSSAQEPTNFVKLPGVFVNFGTVKNKPCVVVNIARADLKERPQLQSIPGVTPAPLIAALASLAWPPHHIEHTEPECYSAYALLRELGRVIPARESLDVYAHSWKVENGAIKRGLIELLVLQGEVPGQRSQDARALGLFDVVVPPGVAEGEPL